MDIAFCMKATQDESNAAKTISHPPSDKVNEKSMQRVGSNSKEIV